MTRSSSGERVLAARALAHSWRSDDVSGDEDVARSLTCIGERKRDEVSRGVGRDCRRPDSVRVGKLHRASRASSDRRDHRYKYLETPAGKKPRVVITADPELDDNNSMIGTS